MAQTELNVDTQAVGLGRISEIASALSSKKIPALFTNSNVSDSVRSTIDGRAIWLAQVSEAARNFAAIQAYEPSSGSTDRKASISCVSLVPARDRLLGPDVSSPGSGPRSLRSKSPALAVLGGLVGFISAVAITDIIPIGQFSLFRFLAPAAKPSLRACFVVIVTDSAGVAIGSRVGACTAHRSALPRISRQARTPRFNFTGETTRRCCHSHRLAAWDGIIKRRAYWRRCLAPDNRGPW